MPFLVYKCTVCNKVLDSYGALCSDCLIQMRKETMLPCSRCKVPHNACKCRIPYDKSRKVSSCAHIAPYLKSGITHRLIISAKSQRNFALFDFMALALSDRAARAFDEPDIIVNIPRSFWRKRKFGFDQTAEIGKRIAKTLGIEYIPALKHRGFLTQKKLNAHNREKNANSSFKLNKKYADALHGKRVILYDDLITSGASARACVQLLKDAGASCIFFLTFAKTEKYKEK